MSLSKVFRELKQQRRDDSSENIAKKMDLSPFKLFCVYLHLLSLSIVSDFSCS